MPVLLLCVCVCECCVYFRRFSLRVKCREKAFLCSCKFSQIPEIVLVHLCSYGQPLNYRQYQCHSQQLQELTAFIDSPSAVVARICSVIVFAVAIVAVVVAVSHIFGCTFLTPLVLLFIVLHLCAYTHMYIYEYTSTCMDIRACVVEVKVAFRIVVEVVI